VAPALSSGDCDGAAPFVPPHAKSIPVMASDKNKTKILFINNQSSISCVKIFLGLQGSERPIKPSAKTGNDGCFLFLSISTSLKLR
jgi:hypothetical protein